MQQFVPRLPGGSRGSVVMPPRNGWTAIYDELCDREPAMLRRLALEVSDRMGAVVLVIGIEYGAVVRYVLLGARPRGRRVRVGARVQGALPPGDVIALGANPTVLQRLTGADPRARAGDRQHRRPAPVRAGAAARASLARLAAVIGHRGRQSTATPPPRELPGAVLSSTGLGRQNPAA